MDILELINSKDIRNHLREIGYKLSPIEMAYIIYNNTNLSLKEKHTAYSRLIENTEDLEFSPRFCPEINSLHEFLRKYISIEEKLLEFENILTEQEDNIIEVFENMWFDIPTPFKKGDIVIQKSDKYTGYPQAGSPFVLTEICYWGMSEEKKEKAKKYYCDMDMTASGYFQNEKGELFGEVMHDYLSLEFYREELTGKQRVLKDLSNYIISQTKDCLLRD